MPAEWNTNPMAQSQALYDAVKQAARCANASCLAALSAAELSAAATKAFRSDRTAHWGPTVDGVETLGSPYSLAKKGVLHPGPLLLGTARRDLQPERA